MRTRWTALLAAGAAAAVLAGCQSATKTNLAEYESLVARRRNPAPSATPMAVRAAQEKAEAEARAAEARAKEAEARAKRAEAEAAAAKEKAAEAEKAAARRAQEKALAEKKAGEERSAAEARRAAEAERKAQEAAEKEASKQAAKEAQRRAAEEQKATEKKAEEERKARAAAEKKAEEERKAREAAEREAAKRAEREAESTVEVVAPPKVEVPAFPSGRIEPGVGANTAYVLAVGDAVQIILRGIPGGEAIEDIIDEGGYVTLPLIDEVMAAGCTATQLEKAIRDTYRERRIYKDINVQVMVPTRFYYMQGEIRAAGRVQLISAVRLSQAIAANGGGTEFWNGKVVVKRNDGRIVNVKNARRLERTPEEDILLEPGDIVELKRGWL